MDKERSFCRWLLIALAILVTLVTVVFLAELVKFRYPSKKEAVNVTLDWVTRVAVLATALATYFAASAARRSAKATEEAVNATKQTAQGQFFFHLLREYSSEEMFKALKGMRNMYERHKGDMAGLKKTYRISPELFEAEYELSRRRVSHYFQRALELYENQECINQQFFETICKLDGLELLYRVVEWLEQAINPDYDRDKFDRLLDNSGLSDKDKQDLQKNRPPQEAGKHK